MKVGNTIWYRLGYALERARLDSAIQSGAGSDRALRRLRSGNGSATSRERKAPSSIPWGSLVREARGSGRPADPADLARAALAGAGAALAARGLGSLLLDDASSPDDLGRELARGVADGLALAVLGRHLPGGRLARIGLFAAARSVAAPMGGLAHVIGPLAPPTLRALRALAPGGRRRGRGLLEHAAFAAAFVLLHRRRSRTVD